MEELEGAIREALLDDKLPCTRAFAVSEERGVSPRLVGREATRLGIRISRCQLGLFGYNDLGNKRIVKPAEEVSAELKAAIASRLAAKKLPCKAAWEIAARFKLSKLAVSSAVEALKIRFSDCQLGCFR